MTKEEKNELWKSYTCEFPGCRWNAPKVNNNFCRKHRAIMNMTDEEREKFLEKLKEEKLNEQIGQVEDINSNGVN